jgi:cytochrome c oxidase subunit IV
MAVHVESHSPPTGRAHGAHGHPTARFYILIFFVLLAVTIAEIFVAQEPLSSMFSPIPGGIVAPLIILAVAKFFMIAAFYMHLKQDSRVFSGFFITGLILAVGMWATLMGLFTAHHRVPFDELAWREEMAQSSGGAAGATGGAATGAAAGGH